MTYMLQFGWGKKTNTLLKSGLQRLVLCWIRTDATQKVLSSFNQLQILRSNRRPKATKEYSHFLLT